MVKELGLDPTKIGLFQLRFGIFNLSHGTSRIFHDLSNFKHKTSVKKVGLAGFHQEKDTERLPNDFLLFDILPCCTVSGLSRDSDLAKSPWKRSPFCGRQSHTDSLQPSDGSAKLNTQNPHAPTATSQSFP